MLLIRFLGYTLKTTKLKPNQHDFLDLIKAPVGSKIPITPEEKEKINQQIDKKMQQLEDTGLSREEILLSKSQKGLPLAIDPFFQYLKRNRLAREIYLKKNERFSVQKIIDIALRQEIGSDPSYSRSRDTNYVNEKGRAELMNDLQESEPSSFNPSSYYANEQMNTQKLEYELKKKQPLRHIYKPINRYERVKTHQRKLKKYDIHWRNVELLRQFMTVYGNIKSQLVNRLSRSDQKKVKMAIKTARHNCAIPFYGKILTPNKRNITNIEDQVKQIGLQNVNLQTGHIYYSRPVSMDSKQLSYEKQNDLDFRYEELITGKTSKLWIDSLDAPQDQTSIKSERYARYIKQQQNQSKKDQKVSNTVRLKKLALKQLTGIEESDFYISPDQSEQCKQSFEKRKKIVAEKLEEDPLSFSKIILEEKTLL